MKVDDENEKFAIFENDNYSLIATINLEKNSAETILNIHLDNNNIIPLGNLINDNTTHEWPKFNDDAVAILRNKDNSTDNEILFIYYVPNNAFIFGKQYQLKILYQILFEKNNKEELKLFKELFKELHEELFEKNDKTKMKVHDFKKTITLKN